MGKEPSNSDWQKDLILIIYMLFIIVLTHWNKIKSVPELRLKIFGSCEKNSLDIGIDLSLFVSGRLVAKLRLDLLVDAVSMLQKEGCLIDVLLVGDGPQRTQLEAAAKIKDLSVIFYGACYEEEILARLIMSANVTVVPGAIGLTVMHSLIYGTPVITNDDPDEQGPNGKLLFPELMDNYSEKGIRSILPGRYECG